MKPRRLLRAAGGVAAARFLGRRSPLAVSWAVTHRCDHRCRYCDLWRADTPELDTDQALRLVGEIAAAGAVSLSFTGGEPLLREDVGRLVRAAADRGLAAGLNSNGRRVPDRLDELRPLSRLTISLEGPADVHDAVRGRGAHAAAVRAIEAARGAGIDTAITATVNARNAARVLDVVDLAAGLGVTVGFQPAEDVRLGSEAPNPVRSDPAALRRAFATLVRHKATHRRSPIANSLTGLRHLARWPEERVVDCASGRIGCRIEPDGAVYHCGMVRVARPGGNAAEVGFEAAFRSLPRVACGRCWCGQRMELNLLYRLAPEAVLNTIRYR